MGERMFIIMETREPYLKGAQITESELKRRLRAIIAMEPNGRSLDEMAEEATSLLLHGERKDAWQEWIDSMPLVLYGPHYEDFKAWLRKMPREGKLWKSPLIPQS